MTQVKAKPLKTADMVYIALFAVLITVCSWISIPTVVPFTLQTFAVFSAVSLLGGKRGAVAVLLYMLLGAVGLPVFHGFLGGVGVLFGATGGYIIGFLLSALVYWLITALFGTRTPVVVIAMFAGLLVCYVLGTVWFMAAYAKSSGPVGLATALGWCVFPFVVPDLLKIALAVLLTKRLKKYVKL